MRRGDLFVLSWESLRRVEWGKVSSFLSMSGGGLFNSLLMGLLLRWSWTIVVWMVFMFRFIVFSSIACVGSGSMFRVYWLLLNIVFFFSRGGWGWVVSLCSGWSGCEAFCRSCELWSLRCFSIGRILLPNRCQPLRGWKTRPEKERRGRPNRHHSIPAPRERGLIQLSLLTYIKFNLRQQANIDEE